MNISDACHLLAKVFQSRQLLLLLVLLPVIFFLFGCSLPSVQDFQALPLQIDHESDFTVVRVQEGQSCDSLARKYLQDAKLGWVISEFNDVSVLQPGELVVIPLGAYRKGGLQQSGYQIVPVLSYHKFSKTTSNKMTVLEKDFVRQMQYLMEHGYRVISMDAFFDFLEFKSDIPSKSVVITIDDGWRSTYDIAFPILQRFGYPATLFVYTDLITGSRITLDWSLIQEMSEHNIDVQCHTRTHRNLLRTHRSQSFREYFSALQEELGASRKVIENKVRTDIQYLAYPYGDTNSLVVGVLEKMGYRGAFSVERGSNPFFVHPYRIQRNMIYGDYSLQDFAANLKTFHSHRR